MKYTEILSIDPGTRESAYILFNNGSIIEKGIIENNELLDKIKNTEFYYEIMSIEMVASYGMAVGKDIFETVVWIGRFMQAAFYQSIHVTRVYRKDVKIHLCHSMRAKDSNIRQSLIDKYGKPGTKNNPNKFYNDSVVKMSKDLWAALGILDYIKDKHRDSIPLEV